MLKLPLYRPFANGAQFADWVGKNCGNCKRSSRSCEIELELWTSWLPDRGERYVSEEIAKRMNFLRPDGYQANLEYVWPCGEIEPTSELAEHAVQHWRELHAK